jgi:hypothetical protein
MGQALKENGSINTTHEVVPKSFDIVLSSNSIRRRIPEQFRSGIIVAQPNRDASPQHALMTSHTAYAHYLSYSIRFGQPEQRFI